MPIEDEIDVISVGLTFKRFLEIAKKIDQPVAVVTDNDGDYANKITEKYKKFSGAGCIGIFADNRDQLYTLECQLVEANKDKLSELCATIQIDNSTYDTEEKIAEYMMDHKTEWALRVFESTKGLNFPKYVTDAVGWCNE